MTNIVPYTKQTPSEETEGQGLPMPIVVAVCFVASVVVFLLGLAQAHGEERGPSESDLQTYPPTVLSDGGLYFPDETGQTVVRAPLLKTELNADVSGLVARYTIRQHFNNPTKDWTEAIYTFPLPDDAAVDRLTMTIGQRSITGDIQEKEQARRTYQAAKSEGRKASLLAQHRPNIFSTSLANIGPGETIVIEIGFQETLAFTDGRFQLRMPLVVGPRYIPGPPLVADLTSDGWALAKQIKDAKAISPPYRGSGEARGNPISLSVRLDPGFPMGWIDSPSHLVTIDDAEGSGLGKIITLALEEEPQDRDFVLNWGPKPGDLPHAGAFTESLDGEDYSLIMMVPPVTEGDGPEMKTLPRIVTFIIDTSGSMHGPSIDQAKAALSLAIERLSPNDRFNVIAFSTGFQKLFAKPEAASPATQRLAIGFVKALQANGGTNMLPAINDALTMTQWGTPSPDSVQQVLLITDGAIGNEQDLFHAIGENRGQARVFTVGIGSAPNSYLMHRAAELGRGAASHISRLTDVGTAMTSLLQKLEQPAATDIALTWSNGARVETYPAMIPDLYAGEPLVVTAKLPAGQSVDRVTVSGRLKDRLWSTEIALIGAQDNPGVAAIWAREKIRTAMTDLSLGDDHESVRNRVVETALKFKLVSQYTALVAVDKQISRPEQTPIVSRDIPLNMPEGWSQEAVFGPSGDHPTQDSKRQFNPHQSLPLQEAMNTIGLNQGPSGQAIALPQGATSAAALILGGLMLMTFALLMLLGLWQSAKCRT